MQPFFSHLLEEFLTPAFIEATGKRYHYPATDLPTLHSVASTMLPLLRKEACWERHKLSNNHPDSEPSEQVAMTLGMGVDRLQEDYTQQSRLTESYMLEVLSSELLLRGYEAYNHYISSNTTLHVARYHFPGGEEALPLDQLPHLLQNFSLPITCNEALCLLPKKSVVFIADLTADEEVVCGGICLGCQSRECPNRMERCGESAADMAGIPLNYGYSRIFSRQDFAKKGESGT